MEQKSINDGGDEEMIDERPSADPACRTAPRKSGYFFFFLPFGGPTFWGAFSLPLPF